MTDIAAAPAASFLAALDDDDLGFLFREIAGIATAFRDSLSEGDTGMWAAWQEMRELLADINNETFTRPAKYSYYR